MSGRTPGPWKSWKGRGDTHAFTISGPQGQGEIFPIVADVCIRKEAAANAAFIVRACNSHDALVEALRGAVGALEFSRDYHHDLGNEDQAFAQDKLDAALAALRLAEGEPR